TARVVPKHSKFGLWHKELCSDSVAEQFIVIRAFGEGVRHARFPSPYVREFVHQCEHPSCRPVRAVDKNRGGQRVTDAETTELTDCNGSLSIVTNDAILEYEYSNSFRLGRKGPEEIFGISSPRAIFLRESNGVAYVIGN